MKKAKQILPEAALSEAEKNEMLQQAAKRAWQDLAYGIHQIHSLTRVMHLAVDGLTECGNLKAEIDSHTAVALADFTESVQQEADRLREALMAFDNASPENRIAALSQR